MPDNKQDSINQAAYQELIKLNSSMALTIYNFIGLGTEVSIPVYTKEGASLGTVIVTASEQESNPILTIKMENEGEPTFIHEDKGLTGHPRLFAEVNGELIDLDPNIEEDTFIEYSQHLMFVASELELLSD